MSVSSEPSVSSKRFSECSQIWLAIACGIVLGFYPKMTVNWVCLACTVCAPMKLKISHALCGLCVHGQFAVGWVTYICTEFEARGDH